MDGVCPGIIYRDPVRTLLRGLMVVLFAVGFMNLGWMALLAVAVFNERVFPRGPFCGQSRRCGALDVGDHASGRTGRGADNDPRNVLTRRNDEEWPGAAS